tara:strand:- start:830 stop:1561 length:732 start_codon:yes stop_codon:yes gene_type:complete
MRKTKRAHPNIKSQKSQKSQNTSKRQFIYIPGRGSNSSTNKIITKIFPRIPHSKLHFFDYQSKSKLSDNIRLLWDTIGLSPTDAVNRLVELINSVEPTHIIAHSHGSLILFNSLQRINKTTLKKIKWIRTYGGRKPIPNTISDHHINCINHYNKLDRVLHTLLNLNIVPQEIIDKNGTTEYDNVTYQISYSMKDTKGVDIMHKNSNYTLRKKMLRCSNDTEDSHKIGCYMNTLSHDIKELKAL